MKHIFNVETKVGAHTVESDMFQEPKFPHKCNLTSKIGVETQGYFCWKLSEKKLGGKRSRLAWPLIFEPSERLCPLRTLISLIVTLGNSWNGLKTEKKTLFLHFIKLNNMYQLTETTGRSRSERQRRIYVTLTCTLTLQPPPRPPWQTPDRTDCVTAWKPCPTNRPMSTETKTTKRVQFDETFKFPQRLFGPGLVWLHAPLQPADGTNSLR